MRRWHLLLVGTAALAGVQPAIAAPSNDALANAMVIESIPFDDQQVIGEGTLEADEPRDCIAEPTSMVFSKGSVWYRYSGPVDRALHITATRNVGSEGRLGIFRQSESGLELVACSKAWDDEYEGSGNSGTDTAELLLQAEAGVGYLVQVAQGRDGELVTDFAVRDASEHDLAIVGLSVTRTATGAQITVDAGAGRQQLLVVACSPDHPEGCTQIYRSELVFPSNPWDSKRWTVRWDPATCLGDMTIRASLTNPFAVDPVQSNNVAATEMWMVAEGFSLCGHPGLPS